MNWVYFLFIGWWLGSLWFMTSLALSLTIIGAPAGIPMLHRTPEMLFGT